MNPYKPLARKILENADNLRTDEFVNQTYALTGDKRLISKKILLPEQYIIAFHLLVQILASKQPGIIKTTKKTEKEKTTAVTKIPSESIKPITETEIPDYYQVLGVPEDATYEEIRDAYRQLAKKYHPDRLINQGLSENELNLAKERMQTINDAWLVLSKEKRRKTYDDIRKNPPKPSSEEVPAQITEVSTVPGISITPTKSTGNKVVNSFAKDVEDAGFIELGPAEKAEVQEYLPQGFNGEQLTYALNAYAKGVTSKELEVQIDKSIEKTPGLTDKEIQSLYAPAYLVATFEEYEPKRSLELQTSFKPEVVISQVPYDTPSTPTRSVFQQRKGGFSPAIRELIGQGTDIAKNKVKNFALSAIKKGGKKLAKEATKKGAGVALKAGVEAAAQALGTTVPVIGNIIAFIGTEVLSRAFGAAKKAFSKITDVIFGKKDKEKKMAAVGGLLFAGGLFLGSIPLLVAGGLLGIGSLVAISSGVAVGAGVAGYFTAFFLAITAPAKAVGAAIIVAIFAIPLVVALILFIINSGAYVVPEGPPTATASESLYIDVDKVAEPEGPFDNGDLSQTITYTITVTATRSTLTNINFEWKCQVLSSSSRTCPAAGDVTVNGEEPATLPPPAPDFISPTNPYVITYTMLFRSGQFEDTAIVDTFIVTADAPEASGERASGSATVIFGNPPTACIEFEPTDAPFIAEFQAAAAELASHVQYAAKLCSAGPILARLNTTGPEVTGACAGVTGTDTMFFNNCKYFRTHGQAFITYLFAHESGHLYAKRIPGDYSQFLLDNVPAEGYLPTYCIQGQPVDWEDFADTIGDYVDNGRLGPLCAKPDERPFVLCDTRFVRHCKFAQEVLF